MSTYQAIIAQAEKLKELSEKLSKESQRPISERAEKYQQTLRDAKVKPVTTNN